nr:MAG TPA: hypothetical protein [Caudoviricetes sp.]
MLIVRHIDTIFLRYGLFTIINKLFRYSCLSLLTSNTCFKVSKLRS